MDQEHLLDAVDQRVEQDDLGKRLARAPRRQAPPEGTHREALLERAVERVEHAAQRVGDRLADRGPDDREQGVGQWPRVAADRAGDDGFDRRHQRLGEPVVAAAMRQRLGQAAGQIAAPEDGIVQPRAQVGNRLALRIDQQVPQLVQAVGNRRRSHHTPSAVGRRNWLLSRMAISVKRLARAARSAFSSRSSPASRLRASSSSWCRCCISSVSRCCCSSSC